MSGYEYMYEADHQISSGLFPISVVIPFYNGHAWIREALLSVLAQRIPPAEIIIVDDCSPQPLDAEEISNLSNDDVIDYPAILSKIFDQVPGPPTRPLGKKSRPVIRIAHHPVNKGIAATRNTGVRLSSQPFIMFLDQDDIWLPDKTVLQMRVLKETQTESPALVYGWIWTLRAKDGKSNQLKRTISGTGEGLQLIGPRRVACAAQVSSQELMKQLLLQGNFVPWITVCCRKSDFEALGGMDESLRGGCDDYDFVLRAAAAGWHFLRASEQPVAVRREHGENFSDAVRFYEDTKRILGRLVSAHPELDRLARHELARAALNAGKVQHLRGHRVEARHLYAEALAARSTLHGLACYGASYLPMPLFALLRAIRSTIYQSIRRRYQ